MQIKYIKDEKNDAEIELNNLTVAEILRVYLMQDEGVEMAAWKRDHPTKNPILKIKTDSKTVSKALKDAIEKIEKDLDKVASEMKKSVK